MHFIVAKIIHGGRQGPQQLVAARPRATRNELEIAAQNNRFQFEAKDRVAEFFTNENEAIAEAQRLAIANPTIQYGVFRADAVYETTTPQVVKKGYNQDGELIVLKENGNV